MRTLIFDEKRPLDLIAMGRVAVDFYAEQVGAPLFLADTFRKYLGGCAGNIAVGCARLGLHVSMLSCVGDDELGKFLVHELRREGVDTKALQTSTKNLTGLVVLGVCPPDHFPLIFYRNDCADMAVDKSTISREYLSSAKALLITGTGLSHAKTRDTTLHALRTANEVNTKVILDIDYRPVLWGLLPIGDGENRYVASSDASEIFSEVLPLVDLIVGTEEECLIAGGCDDVPQALKNMRTLSTAPIVQKRGARGALWFGDDISLPISSEAFSVDVMNVLGAGDGFMAGLLSGVLRSEDISSSLKRGNAAGALVVSRHGCSHATPSEEELDLFMKSPQDRAIPILHQRTLLKDHERYAPMPVLAFCHRWQLEEQCTKRGLPFDVIADFKTALAYALVNACSSHQISNAYMLCDPQYGKKAMNIAQAAGLNVITAIEQSGVVRTEWIDFASAYEILIERPPHFGVKVLWQFHGNMSDDDKAHQLSRLKEIARACDKLDRKLMLELIVPKDFLSDEAMLSAVKSVYQHDIFPYWWKIASLSSLSSWQNLASIIDEFDAHARVVILGGEAKNLSDYARDFAIAKTTHHGIGFAVGRSIFWDSFCGYIDKRITLDEVRKSVADRFLSLYQIWQKA